MCYIVSCATCGKSSWGGCGRHVESVYRQIKQGDHCLCRGWPGVKLPDGASAVGSDGDAEVPVTVADQQSSSVCSIL
ncbi:hypothetical protein IHE45_15G031900 [Dioscorea alata]|uniref:Uncharacterized protein n=1 Tax=Dioscorea alata TaxID=55571 RepID=A0ACB7UKR7_DIOAL|nr:hypothetical protein IHE45_15G031900 [Dioscorea alata]